MLFQHACRKTLRGRHLGRHVGATCLPQCARITAGILAGTLFLRYIGRSGKATRLRLGPAPGSILAILDLDLGKAPGLYFGHFGPPFWQKGPWLQLSLALAGAGELESPQVPPKTLFVPLAAPVCALACKLGLWVCMRAYIHTSMHTYIHTDRHGSSKPNSLANSGQILDLQSSLANPDLNMCRRVLVTAPLVFWPPGRWVILSPPTRRRCSLRRRASCHCERSRVLAAVGGWVGIFLRQKSGTLWLCQNSYWTWPLIDIADFPSTFTRWYHIWIHILLRMILWWK